MTKAAAVLAALCAAVLVSLGASAPAQAANTRGSISDFQWSVKNPQIDLGESVTWDWIGPDTVSYTHLDVYKRQFPSR